VNHKYQPYTLPQDSYIIEYLYNRQSGYIYSCVNGVIWNNGGTSYDAGGNSGFFKKGTVFSVYYDSSDSYAQLSIIPIKK